LGQFAMSGIELLLHLRQIAVLLQQELVAEIAVTFRVRLPVGRVPAQLQEWIEGFGDGFTEAEVECQVHWPDMMVQVVGAKPGRQPHVVRVGLFSIRHALPPDEIARKQRFVPDFDIVARVCPIVEPLDPGIVATADPVGNGAEFARTGLFAGRADEGLGRQRNGFRDLAGLVSNVLQEFQEGPVVVEVRSDGESIFASAKDVDFQDGMSAIGIRTLGHHFFFRGDAL